MRCPNCPIPLNQHCLGETVPQLAMLCEWARSSELRPRVAMRCALGWTEPGRIPAITTDGPSSQPILDRTSTALPLAGDLVESLAHRVGADRLARWIETKTGKLCGCAVRREKLNRLDAKMRAYLSRSHPA